MSQRDLFSYVVNFIAPNMKNADKWKVSVPALIEKEFRLKMVTYCFMMLFVFVLIFIADTCIKFLVGCLLYTQFGQFVMRETCATTHHPDFYQTQQTFPRYWVLGSSIYGPCCCETALDILAWTLPVISDHRCGRKVKRVLLMFCFRFAFYPL